MLEQVLEKFPKDVKLVFKNFPLPSHRFARKAAAAALAAERQGKFWEYHDMIFDNMKDLSDAKFTEFAKELGLDAARFSADMKDPVIEGLIQRDVNEGREAGIRGTPSVFVNGKTLKQRNAKGFATMIQAELKKKGR